MDEIVFVTEQTKMIFHYPMRGYDVVNKVVRTLEAMSLCMFTEASPLGGADKQAELIIIKNLRLLLIFGKMLNLFTPQLLHTRIVLLIFMLPRFAEGKRWKLRAFLKI